MTYVWNSSPGILGSTVHPLFYFPHVQGRNGDASDGQFVDVL